MIISKSFEPSILSQIHHAITTPLMGIFGLADIFSKSNLTPEQRSYINALLVCAASTQETQQQLKTLLTPATGEVSHD